ncbi:MAG: carboxylating nicotinate-nucleotide diphosphorylase [Phycisphaerales bacterium]|nr:MAG: carboxylating nicotinate-nucleotide diphosphorylase [Phycisphaerales bacterium]
MRLPGDVDAARLRGLIGLAREEDMGSLGDVTSQIAGLKGEATGRIVVRRACVVAGMAIAPQVLSAFDPSLVLTAGITDGQRVERPGTELGRIRGPAATMLSAERTLLNFLQRMSGVATLTWQFVDAVVGTDARIYDTRKTAPAWRDLDKYAVRCGGGHNHRHGLHDAVLLKDNHLAGVPVERLAEVITEMRKRAAALSPAPGFFEVEVDTLEQLEQVLRVEGVDVILLDNFTQEQMERAVRRRDALELRGRVELEASGGIDLATVRSVAETGIDRIAVGALTHSAPAADIGLDIAM